MPRSGRRAFVFASLLIVSSAVAQNKVQERRMPYADPTTQRAAEGNQATAKLLGVRLPRIKFSGETLADVIEHLRTATTANLFVNWRALEAEHVTKELPVTVDLTGLSGAAALDRLLDHVGGDVVRLGWTIDEGVVTISTRRDLAKNTMTRVYDIRRAIHNDATRQEDIDRIIRRVQGIDPLSWRDAGGEVGSVRELSGQLIVTQTPEVHQRIAQELRDVQNPDHPFPLISSKKGS